VTELLEQLLEAAALRAWKEPGAAAARMARPSMLAVMVLVKTAFPHLFAPVIDLPPMNAPGGDC
jgi:hypothetical protein